MSLDAGSKERMKLESSLENTETPKALVAGRAGNVRALVKRDLKRTWPSYLSSGLLNFLLGLVAVSFTFTVWEATNPGARAGANSMNFIVADLFFVLILANLSTNWTSTRYLVIRRDPFSEYVEFLRTLPITPTEAVVGRAAVMLISTVTMGCVFFLPFYAMTGGDLRGSLGVSAYLGFAVMWIAYGIFSGGIMLYLELGLQGGGLRFWCLIVWAVFLVGAMHLCNFVLDMHLVAGSLALVERYGVLPALIALAAGLAGFALLGAATVRSVARRSVKA